ncbi:MAG: LamG domain-containing protein [Ignavibacteriae bacterium]|nr:LamG domain-containing protein [Ignavibacteriota bacterium]
MRLWLGKIYSRRVTGQKRNARVAFVILLFFPLFGYSQPCVSPPSGLIAWWSGDGTSKEFVNGLDGLIQKGATFDTGKVGLAFKFDGFDDHIIIPNSKRGPLDVTGNSISICTWINVFDHRHARNEWESKRIIDKSNSIDRLDGYRLYLYHGKVSFAVNTSEGCRETTFPDTLPTQTFIFLTGTYDGTKSKLYIDALAVDSASCTGSIVRNLLNVVIGNEDNSPFYGFTGLIDELMIFERALTPSEIQSLFHAGSSGVCKEQFLKKKKRK